MTLAVLAFAVAAVAATATPSGAGPERFGGTFALPGKAAATAELRILRTGPLAARLDLTERAGGKTIRRYDVDMTKRIHVIVVDAGFATFQHVHPVLDGGGHFTADVRVPAPGRYYVYADAAPRGIGQQVFRFDVPFGRATGRATAELRSGRRETTGPYTVTLDTLALRAGTPSALGVRIAKAGSIARDLRPYLGGAAHAVFIDRNTLDYIHVHPVGTGQPMATMAGMASLPDDATVPGTMTLHVDPPQPGTYVLWLQFRGRDGLHAARFVLSAQ